MSSGLFIPDWEFHLILSMTREEAKRVAEGWDGLDEATEVAYLAINNSLNSLLLWYGWQIEDRAGADQMLLQWTGETAAEIERVFTKWRGQPAT